MHALGMKMLVSLLLLELLFSVQLRIQRQLRVLGGRSWDDGG